jgi:organic radical activating enzyme
MYCKTVWNGLHILPDGYIRLCSIGSNSDPALDMQRARDADGNVMNILTHELKDIMNSDKHKIVRKLNIDNPSAWSPHCDCCEVREIVTDKNREHPNKSRRLYLMKIATDHIANEEDHTTKALADGTVDWMPQSLDVRFGNLCNQKCVMCSPTFSNQWYDEWEGFFGRTTQGQGPRIQIKRADDGKKWIKPEEFTWYEHPVWWEKLDQMAPHLRHIYVTGGEPMVTPAHDRMLDRLIELGHAKNIWLEYDTNLTAINPRITDRWKHFKLVHVRASMDAIGEQYEIIRAGGKWKKFAANVERMKEIEKESNSQVRIMNVSTCFQISTVYSIIEAEQWAKDNNVDFHLRFLEGPPYMTTSSMNAAQKTELINYYTSYIGKSEKAPLIVNYLKRNLNESLPDAMDEYERFMDFLDTTRGTKWREVFPKVDTLLKLK